MRFSIHMAIGDDLLAGEDDDYVDLAAARAEALRTARELIADWLRHRARNVPHGFVEIRGENGDICDLFSLEEAVFGISPSAWHRHAFNTVNHNYLVLAPDLTILDANKGYLTVTMTDLASIRHRAIFDVFPDNPSDPEANGVRNLSESFRYVLEHKAQHTIACQRFDIRTAEGTWLERYWSPVNFPILDENGEVAFIVQQVDDVTARVRT